MCVRMGGGWRRGGAWGWEEGSGQASGAAVLMSKGLCIRRVLCCGVCMPMAVFSRPSRVPCRETVETWPAGRA